MPKGNPYLNVQATLAQAWDEGWYAGNDEAKPEPPELGPMAYRYLSIDLGDDLPFYPDGFDIQDKVEIAFTVWVWRPNPGQANPVWSVFDSGPASKLDEMWNAAEEVYAKVRISIGVGFNGKSTVWETGDPR